MTHPAPVELLDALRRQGVLLWRDDSAPSGMRYRAPKGVVTETIVNRLREAASELLPNLPDSPPPDPREIAVGRLLIDLSPFDPPETEEQMRATAWAAIERTMPDQASIPLGPGRTITRPRTAFLSAWRRLVRWKAKYGAEWQMSVEGADDIGLLQRIANWCGL